MIFSFWIFAFAISLTTCERERVKFRAVRSGDDLNGGEAMLKDDTKLRVLLAIKIKNHAHSLPTFLATLETLKCPSEGSQKCDLWAIFDDCSDQSYDLFVEWLSHARPLFDTIIMIDTRNDQLTREKHVIGFTFITLG
jgi:hypothetical protein